MNFSKYQIGDIVALNIHPFQKDHTDIIVSGDHLQLPPLMVVVEIFKQVPPKKSLLNSEICVKYKCIYYANTFKEIWILEEDIKLIKSNDKCILTKNLLRGQLTILKSANIELSKKKSSISYLKDSQLSNENLTTTITPLLSFLSPVLQIIEINNSSSSNKKTYPDKISPAFEVKCKYYNSIENKISEITLPIDCLELIEVASNIIYEIKEAIKDSKIIILTTTNSDRHLVQANYIAYRCGYYYIRGFDYLTNNEIEEKITESFNFQTSDLHYKTKGPKLDIEKNNLAATTSYILKEFIDIINQAQKNRSHIRFKYKNRNDQLRFKTLQEYKLIKVTKDNKKEVYYLVGMCLLKKEERTFRLDKIQELYELVSTF